MGHFRQSKRRTAMFLTDLLNMPCCAASTVNMQTRVAAALEQPYEDLRSRLENEPQVFMDETPTKQANEKAWLWTAVTSAFAVFAVFSTAIGQKCTGEPNACIGIMLDRKSTRLNSSHQ